MDAQSMPARTALRGHVNAARSSSIHRWPLNSCNIHRRESYTRGLGAVECIHPVCTRRCRNWRAGAQLQFRERVFGSAELTSWTHCAVGDISHSGIICECSGARILCCARQ
jgi:hypothetical protein